MGKQLESFKTSLEEFAGKYKQEIRKNPEFRGHFQQMCARIGVDPLACMSHFINKILATLQILLQSMVSPIHSSCSLALRRGVYSLKEAI